VVSWSPASTWLSWARAVIGIPQKGRFYDLMKYMGVERTRGHSVEDEVETPFYKSSINKFSDMPIEFWARFLKPFRAVDQERDQGCRLMGWGVASWSCHPRAHPVEQNGSPFLTATSGRSLPQHGQRPSRRGEGSALIEG
jgi:hypothetical protein